MTVSTDPSKTAVDGLTTAQLLLFNGNTFGPANVIGRTGTFEALMGLDGNDGEIASCTDYLGVLVRFNGVVGGAVAIYPQGGVVIQSDNVAFDPTTINSGISTGDYSLPYVNNLHILGDYTGDEITLPSYTSLAQLAHTGDGTLTISVSFAYNQSASVAISGDGYTGALFPGQCATFRVVYDSTNANYPYALVAKWYSVSTAPHPSSNAATNTASASAVAVTGSNSPKTIHSFTVAPGASIQLSGSIGYKPQGTTTCTRIKARWSTTTNSFTGSDEYSGMEVYATLTSTGNSLFQMAPMYITNNTAAAVTYYLVAEATYSVAAPSFFGQTKVTYLD